MHSHSLTRTRTLLHGHSHTQTHTFFLFLCSILLTVSFTLSLFLFLRNQILFLLNLFHSHSLFRDLLRFFLPSQSLSHNISFRFLFFNHETLSISLSHPHLNCLYLTFCLSFSPLLTMSFFLSLSLSLSP